MATRIADIIEPKVFAAYLREAIIEKSALINSGLITQNEKLNELVSGGGRTINLPFWKRISGDSEILSDVNPLTPGGIGTEQDVAVLQLRGKAWSANELASAIAGDSAIDAIASMLAEWWVREEQKILISTLTGVFASTTMAAEHVLDKSTEKISADNTLDAKQLLGDAADQLAAFVMHSAVYTELQKQNLIDYIPNARGEIVVPTYLGYRTITDDTVPHTGNVYDTYLLANGIIARGDGTPVDLTPVETDRDALLGDDFLINRRAFVLHMLGVAWTGANMTGTAPNNTELKDGANWNRVYSRKNIGAILLRHTV